MIFISAFFFINLYLFFMFPSLFFVVAVVAVVVVTVSLTFEENPPISFQLLDDPRYTNQINKSNQSCAHKIEVHVLLHWESKFGTREKTYKKRSELPDNRAAR